MQLVERVLAGDRLALSRLITRVENDTLEGQEALDALFPYTGRAYLIGITGSPGTGKSSLVNQLARLYRNPTIARPARRVGVVAIDPTSPFTGGAILGDRVRMRDLAGDPGIFIRSMASRGALGGLAYKTSAVVHCMDAAGYEVIIIETVGAGQSEVDIARLAHTTLVVEAPGLGDDIQAIKAGILEIADILVVNKADRNGVENTVRSLQSMLNLGYSHRSIKSKDGSFNSILEESLADSEKIWTPPICRTVAVNNDSDGIIKLFETICRHEQFLIASGEQQRRDRARLKFEFEDLLQHQLLDRWHARTSQEVYESMLLQLQNRAISPYCALKELFDSKN